MIDRQEKALELAAYVEETHYPALAEWWRAHGQEPVLPQRLPVNGFVAPGVAAAFFYVTDTETAIFEYCLTNPAARPARKLAAIKAIADACMKRAYELGYRHMALLTPLNSIAKIAERMGGRGEARDGRVYCERSLPWDPQGN